MEKYNFRTLNYLGSKYRLLDFVWENIRAVNPTDGAICDLFAGSGCVSYRLSKDFDVVSCDIQKYSAIITDALIRKRSVSEKELTAFATYLDNISQEGGIVKSIYTPLISLEEEAIKTADIDLLAAIVEHGSIESFSTDRKESVLQDTLDKVLAELTASGLPVETAVISRYFGGVFFSYRQAVEIDLIRAGIEKYIREENRNLFLAPLLSTASDLAYTVGKHFAQPLKTRDANGKVKGGVLKKAIRDKTIDTASFYKKWLDHYLRLPKSSHLHKAVNCDYMECLTTLSDRVKTIYADPPYTRDHYSRFYHVLETLAVGDVPGLSKVKLRGKEQVSNGLYRVERHQSPFCVKSKAPEAFIKMFQAVGAGGRNIILSYSPYDESKKTHPRVVSMSVLMDLAKEYFQDVTEISAGYFTHNKLNSSDHLLEASDEAEVLIICKNPI